MRTRYKLDHARLRSHHYVSFQTASPVHAQCHTQQAVRVRHTGAGRPLYSALLVEVEGFDPPQPQPLPHRIVRQLQPLVVRLDDLSAVVCVPNHAAILRAWCGVRGHAAHAVSDWQRARKMARWPECSPQFPISLCEAVRKSATGCPPQSVVDHVEEGWSGSPSKTTGRPTMSS